MTNDFVAESRGEYLLGGVRDLEAFVASDEPCSMLWVAQPWHTKEMMQKMISYIAPRQDSRLVLVLPLDHPASHHYLSLVSMGF